MPEGLGLDGLGAVGPDFNLLGLCKTPQAWKRQHTPHAGVIYLRPPALDHRQSIRKIRKPTIEERVYALRCRFRALYDARKSDSYFLMLIAMACDREVLDEFESLKKHLRLTTEPPVAPRIKRKRR